MTSELEPLDDAFASFAKRFDRCFVRVYAYVLARVADHAAAQRLTEEVLTRSLAEILDYDEPELDFILLRTVHRLLRQTGGPQDARA